MAGVSKLQIQTNSGEWFGISAEVTTWDFQVSDEPWSEPGEAMNLSRIERDMEALVAEYPADEAAPPVIAASAWTWITEEQMADSIGLMQTIYQSLAVDTSEMAKALNKATEALQEFSKEMVSGTDDDPDRKPSRAERRHPRKPFAAVGSGPSWRNDDRPGVQHFRRRERRDMRRGSRH